MFNSSCSAIESEDETAGESVAPAQLDFEKVDSGDDDDGLLSRFTRLTASRSRSEC